MPGILATVANELDGTQATCWLRGIDGLRRAWSVANDATPVDAVEASLRPTDAAKPEGFVAVPLRATHQELGALSVRPGRRLGPQDELFLSTVADVLAPALDAAENAHRLESEVAALPVDDPIRGQIDASVGAHPENRPTELFAYVGTQVWRPGGLSAQLEATYARFVSDRAALVAVHTGWRGLLDAMDTEIRTASDALAARDAAIAQRQAQHTADAASVDYYRRAYRTKAAQVAAMPASQRQRLQLSWVWWDGTELPMAPAGQTLAAAAALLARDDAALQAQAPAIDADPYSPSRFAHAHA